ncbi:MAG: NifB/NifX family molybdenum-iron cluster-binding protein [Gordonibacter sp.]|nr:NifB/NifX family molybdenum-iron cluster-binding protein [Gordonibacter sp.]
MRIAVASEGLEVAPRFGQCSSYMCYNVECGVIVDCQNMPNPGMPAQKLASLFDEFGVDVLIVNTIEYDVANVFCRAGIEVIAKAHGTAREVAQSYLTRTLTGVDDLCHIDYELDEEIESACSRV